VSFDGVRTSGDADAGTVWRRITRAGDHLVVHLINLVGQDDALWDAARAEPVRQAGILRFRRTGEGIPRVRIADPDADGRLIDVEVTLHGTHASAQLPEFGVWQLVVIGEQS
jgi:dextranase